MKATKKSRRGSSHTTGNMVVGDPRLEFLEQMPAEKRHRIARQVLEDRRARLTSTSGKDS